MKTGNLIPRSDYMAGVVSHDEYYGQFLTEGVLSLVSSRFGDSIQKSSDKHFNDIPLREWDSLAGHLGTCILGFIRKIQEANGIGHDGRPMGISLSDKVCVLKRAARRIRDGV